MPFLMNEPGAAAAGSAVGGDEPHHTAYAGRLKGAYGIRTALLIRSFLALG
jgi:hypothetical protein